MFVEVLATTLKSARSDKIFWPQNYVRFHNFSLCKQLYSIDFQIDYASQKSQIIEARTKYIA